MDISKLEELSNVETEKDNDFTVETNDVLGAGLDGIDRDCPWTCSWTCNWTGREA